MEDKFYTPEVKCLSCNWEGYLSELDIKFAPAPYYSGDEDICPDCKSTELKNQND